VCCPASFVSVENSRIVRLLHYIPIAYCLLIVPALAELSGLIAHLCRPGLLFTSAQSKKNKRPLIASLIDNRLYQRNFNSVADQDVVERTLQITSPDWQPHIGG
jgi:hypothetical protein